MAKEFDIYLNKRLTECDILVYSIPYRPGLIIIHKLILESSVSDTLQTFVAGQTGLELVPHIDEMLKTCYEHLNYATELDATAAFQTQYALHSDTAGIIMSAEARILPKLPIEAESAIQFTVQPVAAYTSRSGGRMESSLLIDAALENTFKNSLLTVVPVIETGASILGTNKKGTISVSSDIDIASELTNLCYRIHNEGQTVIHMAADVLGTELHYPLGEGFSAIALSADVGDGHCSTKYEELESVVTIMSDDVVGTIQQFMQPELHCVAVGLVIEPTLKRRRLLSEMDADSLSAYDDMLLEEIDYVII